MQARRLYIHTVYNMRSDLACGALMYRRGSADSVYVWSFDVFGQLCLNT